MKLLGIKTDKKFYVSVEQEKNQWNVPQLNREYRFDSKDPLTTFAREWFEIDHQPELVQKVTPAKKETAGYKLKDGYPISEKTPVEVSVEFFAYDEDDNMKNRDVSGLYEPTYNEIPEVLTSVDFEIKIVAEIDNFERIRPIELSGGIRDFYTDKPIKINAQEFQFSFLDKILYPQAILPLRTCALSSQQFYQVIRAHIKDNIDKQYAEITSDYDFCFTVVKKIERYEPEKIDINLNEFTKRKPKYETRYRSSRSIIVFETSPLKDGKPYAKYPATPEIVGEDQHDLKRKVDKYLEELMAVINEPLVDCKSCQGQGVISPSVYELKGDKI